MIRSFRNQGTEYVFEGEDTKDARKVCLNTVRAVARRKLMLVNVAASISDLKEPPNNRLEKLRGDREGQYAIRINDQYRVCFVWSDGHAEQVEIVDYH